MNESRILLRPRNLRICFLQRQLNRDIAPSFGPFVKDSKPLDPIDGLLVSGRPPEPWQDKCYLSIKAALERVGRNEGLKVHPLERSRLSELKGK